MTAVVTENKGNLQENLLIMVQKFERIQHKKQQVENRSNSHW